MNSTDSIPYFLDARQLGYLKTNTPFYYTPSTDVFSWLPDHLFSLAAPIVTYWIASIIFHALDISEWKWLAPYRIHESAEVKSRNLVTRTQVVRAVVLQQVVQTLIGFWWMEEKVSGAAVDHLGNMLALAPTLASVVKSILGQAGVQILDSRGAVALYTIYWWAIPVGKLLLGMFIIDTWQYFLHRTMHMNTWLYKKFHSVHHRLYVPYAFGALYNHPLEGFLLDTCGAGIAEALTVDDHCGYKLPWDPLQFMSPNNADYHDIHHQVVGIKSNFSQPFFIHWDVILGTRMTRKDIELRRQERKSK
ncbi:Sphingolipid C4-hydroxylase SUR2 [Grifola frondosa]|uniref:Sphingolipid C4-hydroxylase SUR2 n=1 Tax=Grifola frondosa TaxID=5627 RepID=A0A1C7LR52_GRIFR|nr:Sphingolipid C4-hydroxylase SUR2 [Grifola frondosa]